MAGCNVCPRGCGVDRASHARGFCSAGKNIKIARAALHFGEEPCISGSKGSGTVFFSGCPLKCVFCQNEKISHGNFGKEVTPLQLMHIFDSLIEQGAHNINLVNPTHFAPQLKKILEEYKSGVPVVYNTSGYETIETLQSLEGLVDIYLPDMKYYDSEISKKYSAAPDYFEHASRAVLEMRRQVGNLITDAGGIAKQGLIIRHLILPGNVGQTIKLLNWINDNLSPKTAVSLMRQYTPCGKAKDIKPIDRALSTREYKIALKAFKELGFEYGFVQNASSASEEFIPDFDLTGVILTE
jgi:putative pyruvate formate lyase activating enzyme